MNVYLSFKRVREAPQKTVPAISGTSAAGFPFQMGIVEADPYSAVIVSYVDPAGEPVTLRVGASRLIDSLIGADAAAADEWEPLDNTSPSRVTGDELWGNRWVSVSVRRFADGTAAVEYHRRDRAPIHDWRVGQRIKNEVCGAEWEGIELYPAMSRLVDEANSYHMWCQPDRFPIGDLERTVGTQADSHAHGGIGGDPDAVAVQRDPSPDWFDG